MGRVTTRTCHAGGDRASADRAGRAGGCGDPASDSTRSHRASSAAGLLWRASLIGVVLQVCLHYCDLYDLRTLTDRRGLIVGLMQALGAASLVLALLYYWFPSLIIGRGVFVLASMLIVALVAGWRIAFEWLSVRVGSVRASADRRHRRAPPSRWRASCSSAGRSSASSWWASSIPIPRASATSLINPGVIGTVERHSRDRPRAGASIASSSAWPMRAASCRWTSCCSMKLNDGVQFDHLASVYEEYTGKIAVENLRPSWLIFSEGFRKSQPAGRGEARARRRSSPTVGLHCWRCRCMLSSRWRSG